MEQQTEHEAKWMIIWPSGEVSTARSATEFLVKLCAEQWPPKPTYQELKDQLSKRARAYPGGTGQYIEPTQDDASFLRELFRVGLFDLVEDGVPLVRK
jgi:hypothetical protein